MAEILTLSQESTRLAEVRKLFGNDVDLSEPFPSRPPLWIEPREPELRRDISNASHWMIANRDAIEQALLTFGAIVWRGFPIEEPEHFSQLMEGFEPFAQGYAGGTSDRKTIKGKVMEATRTPPEIEIRLHQEMSYMTGNPRLLAFFCKKPPEEGGETPICDMRGVLKEISEPLRAKILDNDVEYVRHLRNERKGDWRADPVYQHPSWQYRFDTDDPKKIERLLSERGGQYELDEEGGLSFWTRVPTTRTHPITGDFLYFNQLNAQVQNRITAGEELAALMDKAYGDHTQRPYTVRFSNGEPLSFEEFMQLHEIFEKRKVSFAWQAGDIMLLENKLTGHGRHAFTGEREVQVMLFD